MTTDDQYDKQTEDKIARWAESPKWKSIFANHINKRREAAYIIGGILVKNLETLPIHIVRDRQREIREATNVSANTISTMMMIYRTVRRYNRGCSFAVKYDAITIAALHRYANDDEERLTTAVEYIKENSAAAFKALITAGEPLQGEVVFMRFALTPDQKDAILAGLAMYEGHQGQQLSLLVDDYMVMKYAKVA